MPIPSWFRVCMKIAASAIGDYKLGSVLVRSGRIIAKGRNIYNKSSSVGRSFNELRSIHCEIDCLSSASHRKRDIRGTSLFIVRLRKDGSFGNSKPCRGCQAALQAFGIRSVYYSTTEYPFFENWRIT